MGARSGGCSAACNDFTPTACVRNMMTWGGIWHVKLDVGREFAMGCMVRIWEEDKSVLSSVHLTWKANPFIFYSSSLGPSICT
jgi:hypothetical protein